MRSTKPYVVEVSKVGDRGAKLPAFIGLIHRHFQKSLPSVSDAQAVTLTAPVDLLDLLVPADLLNRLESIEIEYSRVIK